MPVKEQRKIWRVRKRLQYWIPLENEKCEACQVSYSPKKKNLHRHHIDGNRYNNPTKPGDRTNIMIVCKSCHKEIHKVVGYSRVLYA